MSKVKRLEDYVSKMTHMLTKEGLNIEKKSWVHLEIRRTNIDLNKLKSEGK